MNEAPDSSLSIRGGGGGDYSVYLDGLPVAPGLRRLNGTTFGIVDGPFALPGTNALEEAAVWTGPLPASVGHGQSGAVWLTTRQAEGAWRPELAYANDGLFANSLGYNRAQASLGGPLGRLQLFAAGVLEGQKSATTGFDAAGAPIFVPAGIDTAVAVPSSIGDPAADTTLVPVYDFAVGRGQCDQFAGSANPGIADNFGRKCSGSRTPQSAASAYQWLASARLPIGTAGGLEFIALNSQDQQREFDYPNLYNLDQQFGERRVAAVYGIVLEHQFGRRGRTPLQFRAYLSAQHERTIIGPLTENGATSTADPFGGFLGAPLDFRWDFGSFPVNDELIRNFRVNEPGTRRSPYDLENRDQYNLVDQYRNNAYGLQGFSESGGPIGTLALEHEHRWVAGAEVGWAVGRAQTLTIGGEFTRHSLDVYRAGLTSQAFADAYREQPRQQALWAEDRIHSGHATLALGIRYDRFDSRASRPMYLNPASGDTTFFPRISSAPGFDPNDPTAAFRPDQTHHAWGPRARLGIEVNSHAELRLGYARQDQLPDFSAIFAGINTDLGITNTNALFGSDLGYQHTDLFEAGVHLENRGGTALDAAVYQRNARDQTAIAQISLYDPQRNQRQVIHVYRNVDRWRVRGLDVRLEERMGPLLTGLVSYSYQQARRPDGDFTPAQPLSISRPHTLAVALAYYPRTARTGTSSSPILGGLGAYATFRLASGTPVAPCTSIVPAGAEEPCDNPILPDSVRLPTTRQLDLRITKSMGGQRHPVTIYVDARNLLNARNVLQAVTGSGGLRSPRAEIVRFSSDSQAFANEAKANSLYDPATGAMNLQFGGGGRSGCADFVNTNGQGAAPDCLYLLQAEQRWGNGDGVFTLAEQQRASLAYFNTQYGIQQLTGSPRRIRVGVQVGF